MSDLKEQILALERALMTSDVRWSAEKLNLVLSPDFREFGRSGRAYDYAETVESLTAETSTLDVAIEDFELAALSDTVMLATYRSTRRVDDNTNLSSLRSSIWRLEDDGNWRMAFHQGTPAATS